MLCAPSISAAFAEMGGKATNLYQAKTKFLFQDTTVRGGGALARIETL
jgi:hypothetical protein